MIKRIHIVSFDVPFPADYGGVIDVFTRVKWFSENGWNVILHCFEYKRPPSQELEKYAEVFYYKRPTGLIHWFTKTPFIVKTRIHPALENILKNTKDEVLLEGLHCSHYLNLQPGKFYVRIHNIEHDYYRGLEQKATGLKKLYYRSEANKLESFEPILAKAKGLLVISEKEVPHFKNINDNSIYVPPIFKVESEYQKTDPFVFFHGNLSVEENIEASHRILDEIVSQSDLHIILAGKNPPELLSGKCRDLGVKLVSNPSDEEMRKLVNTARVHLLWTNNSSGLKLKLLSSLASSGHVVCNDAMVSGSGVQDGFHLANDTSKAISLIEELLTKELDQSNWIKRKQELGDKFGGQQLEEIFP